MIHLSRVARAAVVTLAIPVLSQMRWQESGWIGTCAGVGCMGMRSGCATYTHLNSEGARVTEYCYLDS
jgi:hypothetical protein